MASALDGRRPTPGRGAKEALEETAALERGSANKPPAASPSAPPRDWSLVGRRVEVLVDGSWTAGRVTNRPSSASTPSSTARSLHRALRRARALAPRPAATPAPPAVLEVYDGVRSTSPQPDYLGVRRDSHRFRASTTAAHRLGTAVEAAVAFARHVLGMPVEAEAMEEDDEPVAEFDGVALHLSERSSTGYMGVERIGASFRALGGTHIGTFDTAVEAAVAYARYAANLRHPSEPGRGVLEVYDGVRLYLSARNPTGYLGVSKVFNGSRQWTGTFGATYAKQYLGTYDTAVEAAARTRATCSRRACPWRRRRWRRATSPRRPPLSAAPSASRPPR